MTTGTQVPDNIEQAYELTLVLRSQIGDEAAFEELLRGYSPRLRFYVSKMLGDKFESADDLLQEIWLGVFRALPRLNEAAAFRAWLFRIARDRVSREFRRARIQFAPWNEQHMEVVAAHEEISDVFGLEALEQQLGDLSSEHREALVLRFVEDMSYEEIARVTGGSLGTVRSRIHYAKRALRRALEKDPYETK
jgi:RNA polymerase sigma-70 factor (ECF subfamily)